jgi:SAM-dependent methyltransferase
MSPRDVDPVVLRGYGSCSDDYQRARPAYPPASIDMVTRRFDLKSESVILELGAGTGKLTRALCEFGATVLAVEPVAAMRAHLSQLASNASVVGAAAEAVPLRPASVDAVVAATAFHWFRADEALAEVRRVLHRGGGLALLWNNPDREEDWVDAVWRVVDHYRGCAPRNRDLRWQALFRDDDAFTPLQHHRFAHREEVGPDDLLARIRSISFIAALPDAERDAALNEVGRIIERHPAVRGRERFELPYRTDLYCCWRR